MINIDREITRLINFGVEKGLVDSYDRVYATNKLLEVLELDSYEFIQLENEFLDEPVEILNQILDWAYENNRLKENSTTYRDLLDSKIMGAIMPRPSEIIRTFYNIYKEDRVAATTDYYEMSKASNYIRTDRIAKNMHWLSPTEYGDIEITVNLSKPEKDPKAIAAAKNLKSSSYPKCLLCKENEGYSGRINHPGRQNHRIIPISLSNREWFLQYSPYVYYNEHSIIFSGEHEPMRISKGSFDRLLEFVEIFPHYFIGSNADLPIVGGSILSHDHFQGGNHDFPMAKAPIEDKITFKGFENVSGGIVKWPMSVIRISSKNKEELAQLADKILTSWRAYSDESCDIYSTTKDEPHNTITPIARRRGEEFELDLVLRNNRTSNEHPLGIFHPHSEVHNIKKENIGLIEVMGLAVLPGRLKEEISILAEAITKETFKEEISKDERISKHLEMAIKIKKSRPELNSENSASILKEEIGKVFSRVLEHAGVYKRDENGKEGFNKFISSI